MTTQVKGTKLNQISALVRVAEKKVKEAHVDQIKANEQLRLFEGEDLLAEMIITPSGLVRVRVAAFTLDMAQFKRVNDWVQDLTK